jgi:hypothetical protein
VLVGDFQDVGMIQIRPTAKRAARFQLDTVFSAVLNYRQLLTPVSWMELHDLNPKALAKEDAVGNSPQSGLPLA